MEWKEDGSENFSGGRTHRNQPVWIAGVQECEKSRVTTSQSLSNRWLEGASNLDVKQRRRRALEGK